MATVTSLAPYKHLARQGPHKVADWLRGFLRTNESHSAPFVDVSLEVSGGTMKSAGEYLVNLLNSSKKHASTHWDTMLTYGDATVILLRELAATSDIREWGDEYVADLLMLLEHFKTSNTETTVMFIRTLEQDVRFNVELRHPFGSLNQRVAWAIHGQETLLPK